MPPVYFFNSKKGITMEHNINPDQEVVSQALVDGLLAPYAAAQEQETMVDAAIYETHEVELTETNEVVSLPDFPAVFYPIPVRIDRVSHGVVNEYFRPIGQSVPVGVCPSVYRRRGNCAKFILQATFQKILQLLSSIDYN